MPRVAGIIVNLVPYHHARWQAFARSNSAESHLVEITDRDAFKELEFSAPTAYQRHTLFPGQPAKSIPRAALRGALAARLDLLRPQVLCVSGWALPVSLAALAWAVRARVPVVIFSESNEFDEVRTALKEFIKRRLVALCSAALAGGAPQSDYLSALGMSPDSIFSGYDVVDNRHFADGAAAVGNLKPETESIPSPFFLACCRFSPKKNVSRLIEAYARYFQRVKDSDPPNSESALWHLVVVGDGQLRPDIEAAIKRFGVDRFVHLPGARSYSAIPAFYAQAAAFIHASTTEQWGLVVNEAMASGLPVLVSNRCGCAPDLVQVGKNGFTFDPFNPDEIARLLLTVAAPNFPLAAFGQESRRIIAQWGPERFASGLNAAVDKALLTEPRRAGILDRLLLWALRSPLAI